MRQPAVAYLRAVTVIRLRSLGTADRAGREITSLTRLERNLRRQHPNLLSIHHLGKTADHFFYVMDPDDTLYTTPCTVKNLPPRVHRVVFRYEGLSDLDAGKVDFARRREIVASWDSQR